ncbi:hypothetical protein Tco_0248430 [Tanacetum coccineum]
MNDRSRQENLGYSAVSTHWAATKAAGEATTMSVLAICSSFLEVDAAAVVAGMVATAHSGLFFLFTPSNCFASWCAAVTCSIKAHRIRHVRLSWKLTPLPCSDCRQYLANGTNITDMKTDDMEHQ